MKKILPYLLLNVFISAATMLIVLLIWQKFHPLPNPSPVDLGPLPTGTSVPQQAPSTQDYTNQKIEITTIIGAGDVKFEVLTLKNAGKTAVDLSGWKLTDGNSFTYTFPALSVFEGGAFQLFSGSGVNTSIALYCGSSVSLWKSGSHIYLFDPSGAQRQDFIVP